MKASLPCLLLVAAGVVLVFSAQASAETGKKISVAQSLGGGVAAFPAFTDYATVQVPSSYKSKNNFLTVTVSYQAGCTGGDSMASRVMVGGVQMAANTLPFETQDEDASYQIVSKTYYLVPESQGGPAVPADSMVISQVSSASGTGCNVGHGTMIVTAHK